MRNLVTARAGTPPDGRLGVREPRTEHLVVLYVTRIRLLSGPGKPLDEKYPLPFCAM